MPKLFSATAQGLRRRSADRPIPLHRGHAPLAEPLEARQMLSVSTDASGFTIVTPPAGARVVYVSSSTGSDGNSGLSPSAPLKSLHAGVSLLRDRSGDQLLLKRGDTWHESLGWWTLSGRSEDEPMVIGAYGSGARPTLATGDSMAFGTGASSHPEVDHLDLIGLHFYADARDPNSPTFGKNDGLVGVNLLGKTNGLLIEDCWTQFYGTNINIQAVHGAVQNITIRRSLDTDAYWTTFHSEGIFADGVQNLTLEENVFDHNGWNDAIAGAEPTMFNHDAYITYACTDFVAHGNIFANAGAQGLEARSGGDIQDNVFLADPIGLDFGMVNGSPITPGGVSGIVNGNVFIGTRDIAGQERGVGIDIANTKPGTPSYVSNNIFAHSAQVGPTLGHSSTGAGGFAAIRLAYGKDLTNAAQAVGINDLTLQGNVIYDWASGLYIESGIQPGGTGLQALNDVAVRDNDFQAIQQSTIVQQDAPYDPAEEKWSGGRYSGNGADGSWVTVQHHGMSFDKWASSSSPDGKAVQVDYTSPSRSVGSYMQSLTSGTSAAAADYIANARTLSAQNWQTPFTAAGLVQYMRAGFEEVGKAARDWRAPTAPLATATIAPTVEVSTEDTAITFTVSYVDDMAVDTSSIASGNVHLVGGGEGVDLPAMLVSVSGSGAGPVVATYSVAAPGGVWRTSDHGRYSLVLQPDQVKDNQGFASAGGTLEKFTLAVHRAPKPPAVKSIKFHAKAPQSLAIRFTSDVGSTLDVSDLALTSADGQTTIPASAMSFAYDAAHRTGTWTFPGLSGGVLPNGQWHVSLPSAGITDADGRHLDGNKDGVAGDDFVDPKLLKSLL